MPREHRILITGANGFVGSWLRQELEKRRRDLDSDLTVLTAGQDGRSDWATDIADREQVAALIKESRPSAIIHLAAIAAPVEARKAPRRAWDVNFSGTVNLAYAVLEQTPNAKFIFVGSSEAYGASFIDAQHTPVLENTALKPMTVYGATKAAADTFVGQLAYEGLQAVRFRPFNHTGPGQTDAYVVSAFAKQLAEISLGLRPPEISVGNLSAFRDFLDVRDVVRAYTGAALAELPQDIVGRAFNLSSGQPTQIRSILETLITLSGLKVDVVVDPERMRGPEVAFASGNNSEAFRAFGWKAEIDLSQTLQDVLEDWKARLEQP